MRIPHQPTAHIGAVLCAGRSTSVDMFVSASQDCTLIIWDARTGAKILKLRGHTDWGRPERRFLCSKAIQIAYKAAHGVLREIRSRPGQRARP